MQHLTSNLFFISLVIIGLGTFVWYLLNERPKEEKQSILSIFTDLVFNFLLILLATNFIINIREVLEFPYRVLIFSSNVIFISTVLIVVYSSFKYGEKIWSNPEKAESVTQLLLLIGLVNHLYLYLLYGNLQTVFFILFFTVLLALVSFTPLLRKADPLLVMAIATVVHLVLMGTQPVIYFNFTFYTIPVLNIMTVLIGVLYYERRRLQSVQN